jgi:glutamate-1-semialdehyde 2,1-aminomutase
MMSSRPLLKASPDARERAEKAYRAKTPASALAFERAGFVLPGGVSRQTLAVSPYPPFAVAAKGATLIDADGNTYLDFVNNYTSLIHGHGHEPTIAAIRDTLETAGSAPGLPTLLERDLADELRRRVASAESVRFTVSGSEAVGYALRIARAATGRSRILKFEGGFHGSFDEVQQNVGLPPLERGRAAEAMANSAGVADVRTVVAVYNDLESVADAFDRWPDEIACVVVEPFLGNAALIEARPGFLRAVSKLAHQHSALLVLDEVQSCRLALGAAQEIHDVQPDMTILGKTIGGGLPLAALVGRHELMSLFAGDPPAVPQTGTFNAFPPSLAAGLATLADFDRAEIDALNRRGADLRGKLRDVFAAHAIPAWIGGSGSMFHVALTERPLEFYTDLGYCDFDTWRTVHLELLARGIYLMPRGTGCLSTAITPEMIDTFILALEASLTTTFSD